MASPRVCRGGAILALVAACGGTDAHRNPSEQDRGTSVCPRCTRYAGGETSDFGDGSDVLPLPGGGLHLAPTPCEASEQVSDIDVEAARALGFGAALDRLETAFDVDFEWGHLPIDEGSPPAGYVTDTRVTGTLGGVTALQHHAPTLEGCPDSLRVRIGTEISMADGAFAVTGRLTAAVVRDSLYSTVSGYVDLAPARGTLELFPPEYDELSSFVVPILYVWPDDVRVSLTIVALDPKDIGSDAPSHQYMPLQGIGPADGCPLSSLPLEPDEPNPYWGGATLQQRFPEQQALFTLAGRRATWASGGETTVTTELGVPSRGCAEDIGYVKYQVPYRLVSADGRVSIDAVASALASYEGSSLTRAWVSVYPNVIEPRATFTERSGVSGVDFGEYGGAEWYTGLTFDPKDGGVDDPSSVHGQVTVEGVAVDGEAPPTDTPPILDELTW